ncbi:MAG: class III extradiol ring-cleavage dioxygenase [Thalassobaculales bacterium]
MTALPALFVSHGSPGLVLEAAPARDFLAGLGAGLPRPAAILAVSAHWETAAPMVTGALAPETIHDFHGFPEALYRLRYPAPGDPALAARIASLAGGGVDPRRGLDHGAWSPLLLAYPQADIPVLQLSIQPDRGPAHHLEIGRRLAPLRHEGVLIFASGSATHNIMGFARQGVNAPPLPWVAAFADWLDSAIAGARLEDLLDYRARAPFAAENHPTDEHLLPLYVALGAGGAVGGGAVAGRPLHRSYNYAKLAMDSYAWG